MNTRRSPEFFQDLVRNLRRQSENECLEFKRDLKNPDEIGEYISALSNSAALLDKPQAYLIWGIDDQSHEVIGTRFNPAGEKIGNESLVSWLQRLLDPSIHFQFHQIDVEGRPVVLLEIDPAFPYPVRFKKNEFIRIDSSKQNLREHREKERELWRAFERQEYEQKIAAEHVKSDRVLELLDFEAYFRLLNLPCPEARDAILDTLEKDGLIRQNSAGGWDVFNLGALLLARTLADFPSLQRKAVRIIRYKGRSPSSGAFEEKTVSKGFANGFEEMVDAVMSQIPANEVIRQTLRETIPIFPKLAVRELVANALIHQDLSATGASPIVTIFENRMEVTNPGPPLVELERFIDAPPKSRNEKLAKMMVRFGICEEQGSGIDKVVEEIELFQLPAPSFEAPNRSTRVRLYAYRPLKDLDKKERISACYLHACLKRVAGDYLTNTSLRQRFKVERQNRAIISRCIRDAVEAGEIKPLKKDAPKSLMKYVPFWV
ncbi:MAG: putative DNA binding domain-containing protein [Gammaproteobacteria bacterium AqS3]|nr:putative DNA binding domain-containing protein [Gammaproteobacteria bacterium AqS3]